MKKLENFSNCLEVLKSADFEMADNNDIYRTGVIGQFNLTFELAWKALQEILKYNIKNNIHFYRITSALIPLLIKSGITTSDSPT